MNSSYDAIIIGGGPGGSTAGSVLAQAGKRVLILERERFPRFHVGESLIPYGNEEMRAIGFWPKLEQSGFMPKLGAEFVTGNATSRIHILFGRFLRAEYAKTFKWSVRASIICCSITPWKAAAKCGRRRR